ncbi:MurR/RpiR family transcriptional regulator [Carnobacterium mobile]|uniref:MurR/RpiR family transcriptional regulator n=1 Tax=Carnobacterium mobile TaxID=2750 RepID=UPI00186895E4|nr:MurR/RpiR family transcriptional regulator [Carnobacterium mobile]
MSFFGRINFNDLSEVDRAIYHYMSENSDKIPYMRVRDIANESHTSASSVMRFIRKIGYESFTEFKSHFKAETKQNEEGEEDFSAGGLLLARENFAKDIESKMRIIAKLILNAENIVFFGMGASGAICEYAARRLATVGYNSFALVDPTYPIFSKLKNTSENILITLSVSGKTTEVVEVVNGFKNRDDFTTICITSDTNSSLANMSNYTLSYYTKIQRIHQHEDLSTQIPCIYIIESLISEVQKLNGV